MCMDANTSESVTHFVNIDMFTIGKSNFFQEIKEIQF